MPEPPSESGASPKENDVRRGDFAVWVAVVAIPLFYELARRTPWPLEIVFGLHWGLAGLVLAWSKHRLGGPQAIGLGRPLLGFLCFALTAAAYCAGLIFWFSSQPLADWQHSQMHGFGRWGVILIAISAGFCEEVIYRGYMMTALTKVGQPVWAAMILSSLSFVFFHGRLPIPFMAAGFVIAMIWAAIYYKTSLLWTTISIHGLWDATVLLIPWGAGAP